MGSILTEYYSVKSGKNSVYQNPRMKKFVLFASLFTLFSIFASSLPLEGDEDTSSDLHLSKVEKARIKEQATTAKRSADDKPKERISRKKKKASTKGQRRSSKNKRKEKLGKNKGKKGG